MRFSFANLRSCKPSPLLSEGLVLRATPSGLSGYAPTSPNEKTGIWAARGDQPYWTTFLCHHHPPPPPRFRAIRGLDAKPGLGRFSPAGSLYPCQPPYLLLALAAARRPLDPLSDRAAGARAGSFKLLLETISSALLWESVQFSLLSPCCLLLELSLGFCFPCCPILAHVCVCMCVCKTEDGSV